MNTSPQPARRRFVAVLLVPVLLLLAACSSVPTDLETRSDTLSTQIAGLDDVITQQKEGFTAQLLQEEYAFIADYTPEQQHADRFDQATTKLAETSKAFDERVKPLLDGFDESERTQLEAALTEVEQLATDVTTLANDPVAWLTRVVDTKDNASELVASARSASNAIVTDFALLEGEASTAKESFPAQTETIETDVAALGVFRDTALTSISDVDTQTNAAQPNYAVLATALTAIETSSKSYADGVATLREDFADLGLTETHTLLDFRVDSTVEISRTSWNESQDWPTETDYDFPAVLVTPDTATYFAERLNQIVGKVNYGFFGDSFALEPGIESARWDELGISDPKVAWPDYDNAAEYVISEIEDTYCQKLKVFKNGEPSISDRPDPATDYCSQYDTESDLANGIYWEEADEFNAEAIGMDIYTKAYGDFDDQATTGATPPGMAYVGDPASGEWRTDSSGNSFWYYYGQYAFFSQLIGGPNAYHYRSEYDTWNKDYRRSNEPYYATTGGSPRYGASSPQVNARFPNSTFVSSGLNTATVRNAGPAARTDGPGNGGK